MHSLNGSIPDKVEVRDNILLFKGAVTYDLAGTYLCDATNSIGTRSASVEVNVTGRALRFKEDFKKYCVCVRMVLRREYACAAERACMCCSESMHVFLCGYAANWLCILC